MKIVEDSPSRLVLKEGAMSSRIVGVIFMIGGVAAAVGGAKSHKGLVLYALGAVLVVVGALALFFSKSDTVVADKSSRKLSVSFSSLKNKNGPSQTVAFDDVASVQMLQQYRQEYMGNNNMGRSGISFGTGGMNMGGGNTQTELQMNLVIKLKSGANITIANEQHQAGMRLGISSNSLSVKAKKLADILGVPFQEVGAATAGQVIQGIEQAVTGRGESLVGQSGQQSTAPSINSQPPSQSGNQSPPESPAPQN